MISLKQHLVRLAREDSGQDLIEYALVAALIGLGAVVSMKSLTSHIGDAFNQVGSSLGSAV